MTFRILHALALSLTCQAHDLARPAAEWLRALGAAPLTAHARVLEIGADDNPLFDDCWQLDLNHGPGRAARVAADARRIPFADGAFDVIFSLGLPWSSQNDPFVHPADRRRSRDFIAAVLAKFERVLATGGRAFVLFTTEDHADGTLPNVATAFRTHARWWRAAGHEASTVTPALVEVRFGRPVQYGRLPRAALSPGRGARYDRMMDGLAARQGRDPRAVSTYVAGLELTRCGRALGRDTGD